MKRKLFIPRKVRQAETDPSILNIYPGEKPISEVVSQVISILKVKYRNTNFYGDPCSDCTQIKIKLNECGGQVIPITEQTLDCVRKFVDEEFKKL
jgi:hypothetical protein